MRRSPPPFFASGFACAALFVAAATVQAATLHVGGRDGAKGKHYKNIATALNDLQAGDELVIGPGVYREPIDLRLAHKLRDAKRNTMTIIRGTDKKTEIKGSVVVDNWKAKGDGVFIKRPWSINSQQVFVDGQPLKQIGGVIFNGHPDKSSHPFAKLHASQGGIWPARVAGNQAAMSPNSFFFDAETATLYIKIDASTLDGRQVEVSTEPYLVFGENLSNVMIKDLKFTHANTTSVSQSGALTLIGNDIVVDNVRVNHVDGNGADLSGDRNVVKNSVFTHCGIVGLKVRGQHARVIDNELTFNNTRGFNKWWEAGGAKFVGNGGLRDSEVAGNRVFENRGDGLWFDWKNSNNRIHHNIIGYNAGMGIHYEASDQAHISDNIVFGNRQRGIYLPNSAHSTVAYNLVIGNEMEGIVIVNERRAEAARDAALLPHGNRIVGNLIGWNRGGALTLPDAGDTRSDTNLFLDAAANRFSMGWPTREQPVVNELEKWRVQSSQDERSTAIKVEMPLSLSRALTELSRQPDWEALRPLRERHRLDKRILDETMDSKMDHKWVSRTTAGPSP